MNNQEKQRKAQLRAEMDDECQPTEHPIPEYRAQYIMSCAYCELKLIGFHSSVELYNSVTALCERCYTTLKENAGANKE